jgi:hypothetical protein
MLDDERDRIWAEFERIGAEEVRKQLGSQIWGENRVLLAREWLTHNDANQSAIDRRKAIAASESAVDEARKANLLSLEANDLASEANSFARQANETASAAAASARASADAARTNNKIAMAALAVAITATLISIAGIIVLMYIK